MNNNNFILEEKEDINTDRITNIEELNLIEV